MKHKFLRRAFYGPPQDYIVTARKIPPGDRDVFQAHSLGYREVDGGEDEYGPHPARRLQDNSPGIGISGEVGEQVVYVATLDAKGVEAFRSASNLISLEPDRTVHAVGVGDAPTDWGREYVRPKNLRHGIQVDALNYHKFVDGGDGAGVDVAIGDTGVDAAYFSKALMDRYTGVMWDYFGGNGLDKNGHGTWCVGAAVPDKSAWTFGKVLGDDGSGSLSYVVGFIRAAAKYINGRGRSGVISLSLSAPGTSPACTDAIAYALGLNVLTVCASGNDGPGVAVGSPANSPGAVAVGAIDHRTGKIAGFTQLAGAGIDILAAGVSLLGVNGRKSGTSMATPIVARGAACALAVNRDANAVKSKLGAGGRVATLSGGKSPAVNVMAAVNTPVLDVSATMAALEPVLPPKPAPVDPPPPLKPDPLPPDPPKPEPKPDPKPPAPPVVPPIPDPPPDDLAERIMEDIRRLLKRLGIK